MLRPTQSVLSWEMLCRHDRDVNVKENLTIQISENST